MSQASRFAQGLTVAGEDGSRPAGLEPCARVPMGGGELLTIFLHPLTQPLPAPQSVSRPRGDHVSHVLRILAIGVRFLPFAGLSALPAACMAFHSACRVAVVFRGSWFTPPDVDTVRASRSNRRRADEVHLFVRFLLGPPCHVGLVRSHFVLGTTLREKSGFWRVVGAALASSVSFFLISNFAVWAAWPEMYPRGFSGLMMSYTAGLPFFRGTLESDIFFSLAMFFSPVLVQMLSRWFERAGDHTAAA